MSPAEKMVYLSGAPRVSTKPQAAIGGARTRALGMIRGFEQAGFAVSPFIAGDRCREFLIRADFDAKAKKNIWIRILSDLLRLGYACKNGAIVFFRYKKYPLAYEMLGLMQFLGFFLKLRGAFWILETNALLFKESFFAREATFFWRSARFIEKKCYQKADLIVTVTAGTMRDVMEFAALSADKIIVIPNGVDPEAFQSAAVAGKRFFLEPTIGFVGVMYAWQGLAMLLKAVHDLKKEGVFYKIVLVGDGPEYGRLQKMAAELALQADVVFTGRIPPKAVPNFIAGMDICYAGQVSETGGETSRSPIKTYEYLAMKKPVLSCDFEDAKKIVREGVNGFLFQSGNPENLLRGLRKAFRQRQDWPAMGEAGYGIVAADHTWKRRVQLLLHKMKGDERKRENEKKHGQAL